LTLARQGCALLGKGDSTGAQQLIPEVEAALAKITVARERAAMQRRLNGLRKSLGGG
jgi:hypothetical protein